MSCDNCHFDRLAWAAPWFSCRKRGFCGGTPSPSCSARRIAENAALLTDEVFPDFPLRHFPFPPRYLFAAHPQAIGMVLGIDYRAISTHLIHKAGLKLSMALPAQ